MKPTPVLPPAPLSATCPLWMLVEWSEVFRNGLASRSKILLEVEGDEGPARAGERWLALVCWNLKSAHVRTALTATLRKEFSTPNRSMGLERGTVGEVFRKLKSAGQAVWLVDLFEQGGSAAFIRKPANDPALAEILTFNRQGRVPRDWRLPRRRTHPSKLSQAHIDLWIAAQKTKIPSARDPRDANPRQRGGLPPRRRGQGGTPQA